MLEVPEGRFLFHDYSGETTTLGFMTGFDDLKGVLKLKRFYSSTHSKAQWILRKSFENSQYCSVDWGGGEETEAEFSARFLFFLVVFPAWKVDMVLPGLKL